MEEINKTLESKVRTSTDTQPQTRPGQISSAFLHHKAALSPQNKLGDPPLRVWRLCYNHDYFSSFKSLKRKKKKEKKKKHMAHIPSCQHGLFITLGVRPHKHKRLSDFLLFSRRPVHGVGNI